MPAGLYAPAANLFIYLLYKFFGINASVWAILTLLFHTLNTYLIYWYTKRVTGRAIIGLLTAGLFAFMPMGSQFLHQFSMMPTSGIAVTLALISLILYSYQRSIMAAFFLFLSFNFSPYTIPFLFFLFLTEAVYFNRKKWLSSIGRFCAILVALGTYYYLLNEASLKSGELHDRPISGDSNLLDRLQVIGQKAYQGYSELLLNLHGQIDPDMAVRYSTIIVATSLLLIGLLLWRKQYQLTKTALLGLLWIPASLSLFSTLNTVALDAVFPSRYFYIATAGYGLLIGSIAVGLIDKTYRRIKLGEVLVFLLLVVSIIRYLPTTRQIVAGEVALGTTRKMIMNSIIAQLPSHLGRDALFCFTGNAGHYGQGPEMLPLPFVHNFAFNLAVYYRADAEPLYDFFNETGYFVNPAPSFYYYSKEQKDPDGIGPGIGFTPNPSECKRIYEKFSFIRLDDVHAFAYDEEKQSLTNISVPMRAFITGNQSVESELYPWRSSQ